MDTEVTKLALRFATLWHILTLFVSPLGTLWWKQRAWVWHGGCYSICITEAHRGEAKQKPLRLAEGNQSLSTKDFASPKIKLASSIGIRHSIVSKAEG